MKKAFIIHGAYGNPDENWFPWLKEELAKLGYEVISPIFPTPEEQSLENWNKIFEEYKDQLDENTIMIGHSLGCPFILNVLQNTNTKINEIYLISGFHTLLDHPIDEINKTFVENGFDWEKIKNYCNRVVMFNGSDDKYIRREIADELAKNLDAEYEVIKNGGHLNATAGYTEFEPLLQKIKELKDRDVAVVIFYDDKGNIGVQRRESYSKAGERYGLWGGRKEKGESPEEAMKRELQEELSYNPNELEFWTNFTYIVDVEGKYKDWIINHDVFLSPITEDLLNATVSEGDEVEIMSLEKALEEPDFRLIKPLLEKFESEVLSK